MNAAIDELKSSSKIFLQNEISPNDSVRNDEAVHSSDEDSVLKLPPGLGPDFSYWRQPTHYGWESQKWESQKWDYHKKKAMIYDNWRHSDLREDADEIERNDGEVKEKTVMLRNLPNILDQRAVLNACIKSGLNLNEVNYFYVPMDPKSGNNLGYSFINFYDSRRSMEFGKKFASLKLSKVSNKLCEVTDAKSQGFKKNMKRFWHAKNSAKPLIFENGKEIFL